MSFRETDAAVVLEDGRIVDEGDHMTLLRTSRIYRDIYELQFRPQEEGLRARPAGGSGRVGSGDEGGRA